MKAKIRFTVALMIALVALGPASAFASLKGMMLSTASPATTIHDVQRLAGMGATIVRFPIYFYSDHPEAPAPSLTQWLDFTDSVLAECERLKVVLVIDFHAPSSTGPKLTDENDFVRKWQEFAKRFKDRSGFWYDLCNEPDHPNWPAIALHAATAIRKIDPVHEIVYSPGGDTTRLAQKPYQWKPLANIAHQIIQFHFYDWKKMTDYPDSVKSHPDFIHYPDPELNKERLTQYLQRVWQVGQDTKLPVYIGEVAISREHPDAAKFLHDFTEICGSLNISLTLHAFREADKWDYELNPRAWRQVIVWMLGRNYSLPSQQILWLQKETGGNIGVWFLDRTLFRKGMEALAVPSAGWKVGGSGDFNKDGSTGTVFQNTATGQLAIWIMNGIYLEQWATVPTTPAPGWRLAGCGDFNKDGFVDIVLQNAATGQIALWFMSGTNVAQGTVVDTVPAAGWAVVGNGDFNRDGSTDIVLQNTLTGQIGIWLMKGNHVMQGTAVGTIPAAGWAVRGVADLNEDGSPDIILQNTASQQIGLWLMSGVGLAQGTTVGQLIDPTASQLLDPIWKVVAPR